MQSASAALTDTGSSRAASATQRSQRPLVLGHEIAGDDLQKAHGQASGSRSIPPLRARCASCKRGLRTLCPTVRFAGHGETDGGLRTLLPGRSGCFIPCPSGSPTTRPLLEPLGVALHALDLGHVRARRPRRASTAAARSACCSCNSSCAGALRSFAADPLAHRLRSRARGRAQHAGLAVADGRRRVRGVRQRRGLDAALALVRPGGRVVLVGIPEGDRTSFPRRLRGGRA